MNLAVSEQFCDERDVATVGDMSVQGGETTSAQRTEYRPAAGLYGETTV